MGRLPNPDSVNYRWTAVREAIGVPKFRLHDLLHFQATMLLNAGVPVKNVRARSGHREASTTLNIYAHKLEDVDSASAEVIGQLLSIGRAAATASGRVASPHLMTMIMVMSDVTLPLAEIKKRLSEIVDGVEHRHDRVVLTRNGRPAAVIISPDDLESLEETLEILSDPRAIREIRKAEGEIEKGRVVSAEELRARYLRR